MIKTAKEILKAMTAGRMQANQGNHVVMSWPNLESHFNNLNTND